MLLRPGSKPGPAWMRNISDSFCDPDRAHKILMPFWAFFILYMFTCIGLTHFVTAVILSKDYVYESRTHLAGIPVISYAPVAHGIIALGGRATGVIALGGIAEGVIAVGAITLGVISFGGLSLGILAIAGLAIGWCGLGGLAIGQAALGALSIGRYANAGTGAAYGSIEASDRHKERLIG